jgi:hypothetical protein
MLIRDKIQVFEAVTHTKEQRGAGFGSFKAGPEK